MSGNSYDTVNEKTQRIEIALKYTRGDLDRAKLMVSGKLEDIVVVKGKFYLPLDDKSGVFLVFVNVENTYVAASKSLVSNGDNLFTKIRIFDDWSALFNSILAYGKDSEGVSSDLDSVIQHEFLAGNIFSDVREKNLDYISNFVQDIIRGYFQDSDAKSQIELEETNSVEVDLHGIEIVDPGDGGAAASPDSKEGARVNESAFEETLREIESEAQAIVEGHSVLSPVKGKFLEEISPGDKIYVSLSGEDGLTEKIIDAYKARDHEGNPLPVTGRVVHIVPNEGQGYVLYVLVAKGIYAKMVEEENVKLRTEIPQKAGKTAETQENKQKFSRGLWMYLVFVVFIISLIVVLLLI